MRNLFYLAYFIILIPFATIFSVVQADGRDVLEKTTAIQSDTDKADIEKTDIEKNKILTNEQQALQVNTPENKKIELNRPPVNSNYSPSQPAFIQAKPVGFSDFLSAFLALIIILGLIFFIAWIGKRSGLVVAKNNQIIKIVASTSVGYKEKIALIEVGEQQVLIGVTSTRIDQLMVLDKPVKQENQSMKDLKISQSATTGFMNILNRAKDSTKS